MAAVGGLPDQVEGDAESVVYHHQQLEDPVGGAIAVQEESTFTAGVHDYDTDENVDLPARYSSTGKASTVKLAWAMKFLKIPSSFHLSPSLNTLYKK